MNKFSQELIESLSEACEHAEGRAGEARVHVVEVPDVRAIRRQLRMSQQEFARVYRIPLATLKNWGQGRRQPDAPVSRRDRGFCGLFMRTKKRNRTYIEGPPPS